MIEVEGDPPTVTLYCSDCGGSWQEQMIELSTGYTVTYGIDAPEECPECGGGA